jgi:hypothetical protein
MLKNERKINYMVGLAGKGNDQHRSWTGIQINFWPLVHPWGVNLGKLSNFSTTFPLDSGSDSASSRG